VEIARRNAEPGVILGMGSEVAANLHAFGHTPPVTRFGAAGYSVL
jgi:hypothetical protein